MPRRRLHGITQQRRKKKRTRLLKLQGSVRRQEATQRPEAFERTPRIEREDLEFLEIMRELEVSRSPWSGEAPQRREAHERVRFLAEESEAAVFQNAMQALGVRRLPAQAEPHEQATGGASPSPEPVPPQPFPRARSGPAASSLAGAAPGGGNGDSPGGDGNGAALNRERRSAAPRRDPPPGGNGKGPARAPQGGEPETTRFETGDDDRALLETLLSDPRFNPELKFAGAPRPTRRAPAPRIDPAEQEPDGQLDLHGHTQEESVRLVQNFLLVSHRQRLRHVLIITGRGRNSGEQGPVLREVVYRWLERNGGRYVRAFEWALPRHGGEGALWVTLR